MNQSKTNPGPDGEGLVDPLLGPRHLGPHHMALKYSRAHPHQRGTPSTLQEPVPLVNQPPHRTNPLSLPESQSAGVSDSDDDSLHGGQPEMSEGGAGARNARKKAKAASKKTRGRVKIKVEFIDNKLRRYTTFSKRKTGIMKKAYELSTLTGTQVMLLVASETGHVYTFATPKLQPMITSEAGKTLIQTCLNSPDQPGGGAGGGQTGGQGGTSAVEPDQRMNPTGYEETELTYNVPEETVSASGDQGQKAGGFEDGIDTECGLDDQPLPGPSRRNTDYVNEGSETEEGDEVDEVQNDQPIALVKKTPNKKSPDSPPPIRSPKKKVRVSPAAAVIVPPPPALPSQRVTLTGVSAIPAGSQSRINPPQLIHPPAAAASAPLRSIPARLQIQPSASPVVIAVNQQPTPAVQAPLMVPTVAPTPQAQPSSASAFLSSSGSVTLHQPQHLQVRQHIGHIVKPDGTVVSIQAPPPTALMASPPPILLNSPPAGFSANSPVPLVLVQPQQTPPQHHQDSSPLALSVLPRRTD